MRKQLLLALVVLGLAFPSSAFADAPLASETIEQRPLPFMALLRTAAHPNATHTFDFDNSQGALFKGVWVEISLGTCATTCDVDYILQTVADDGEFRNMVNEANVTSGSTVRYYVGQPVASASGLTAVTAVRNFPLPGRFRISIIINGTGAADTFNVHAHFTR